MYATKRKFQSLINSITSSTNVQAQASPGPSNDVAGSEGTSKRRRIAEPAASRRVPNLPPTIKDVRGAAPIKSSRGDTKKDAAPNYAPWDRQRFLDRLKTYRHVDKWSTKPAKVNEVQWAKRGWVCVGKETVGCVGGCGKEVVVLLDDGGSHLQQRHSPDDNTDRENSSTIQETEEALVGRYQEMIVSEHADYCLWKVGGCDDTVQRLPLSNPIDAVAGTKARFESLLKISSELPGNLTTPSSELLNFVVDNRSLLLDESSSPSPDLAPHALESNRQAFIMAAFGWQADEGHVSGLVTCSACFRRLGLWLFKQTTTVGLSVETPQDGTPKPGDGDGPINGLDIVSEHRDYCPWVDAVSQNGLPKFSPTSSSHSFEQYPGWQVLFKSLRSQLRLRNDKLLMKGEHGTLAKLDSRPSVIRDETGGEERTEADKEEDIDTRLQKDKERWARLRQLKKVFEIKKARPKSASSNE